MIKTFITEIAKGILVDILVKFIFIIALIAGAWYSFDYIKDHFISVKTEAVKEKVLDTYKTSKALVSTKVGIILDSNTTKNLVGSAKNMETHWRNPFEKYTKETP